QSIIDFGLFQASALSLSPERCALSLTMITNLDSMLASYGELAVKIALNLQPGQRLLIIGPIANGGVSLDAAPLLRKVAESAYRAGASYVEALWGDEALQ